MEIAFFNTKQYDREFFDRANQAHGHTIHYYTPHLTAESTALITTEKVVCAFINDCLNAEVLNKLKQKAKRKECRGPCP